MDNKEIYGERLHNQGHRITQFKEAFAYYILAIDAACIGFTLNYTKDANLSWWLILVAMSIMFWGYSFYCGIRELLYIEKQHQGTYNFLEGIYHDDPELKSKKFEEANINYKKLLPFKRKKMHFLYYGVALFVAWDIANIVMRSCLLK